MAFFRRFFLWYLCLQFLLPTSSFAGYATVPSELWIPASSNRINITFGKLIKNMASSAGIAANDAKVFNTLKNFGRAAKNLAVPVGAVVAAAAPPGWIATLATVALTFGPMLIDYAIDSQKAVSIVDGSATPIVVKNTGSSTPAYPNEVIPSGSVVTAPGYYGANKTAVVNGLSGTLPSGFIANATWTTYSGATCSGVQLTWWKSTIIRQYYGLHSDATNCYFDGYRTYTSTDSTAQATYVPVSPVLTATVDQKDFVEGLTADQRASVGLAQADQDKLAAAIAATFNQTIKNAALAADYDGVPVSMYAPLVTAEDVKAAYGTDPITVADLTMPSTWDSAVPETGFTPVTTEFPSAGAIVSSALDSGTTNPTAGALQVDFGTNPQIGEPALETIPTEQSILDPILNMLPGFRDFQVASHNAVCPQPSIQLFGQTITMTAHCTVMESQRDLIYSTMIAVWSLISVLIILRA